MAHDALEKVEYRDSPAVRVFADCRAAAANACQAVAIAGCRAVGPGPVAGGAEIVGRCAVPGLVMVEIGKEDGGDALMALLDGLEAAAERGLRTIVAAPLSLLERIGARASRPEIEVLFDPTLPERVAALVRASVPRRPRFSDIGTGEGSGLLQQLSEEVSRIASILASLTEEEGAASVRSAPPGKGGEHAVDAAYIRALIRARRLRDHYVQGGLFADPAWDMLLDLMAARLEQNRVAVSSLCIAAAVPPTTALRWIKSLTDRGLLIRHADPQDGRRVYIELSDETALALAAYFQAVQRLAPPAV